jgi:urease beta subunit
MIPGESITLVGDIELNTGAETITLKVAVTCDQPVKAGSHYHCSKPIKPCVSTAIRPVLSGSVSPPAPQSAPSPAENVM